MKFLVIPCLCASAAVLAVLTATATVEQVERSRTEEAERASALAVGSTIRARLEKSFDRQIVAARSLGLLMAQGKQPSFAEFQHTATILAGQDPTIRTMSLSQNGMIRLVYPDQPTYQSLVGLKQEVLLPGQTDLDQRQGKRQGLDQGRFDQGRSSGHGKANSLANLTIAPGALATTKRATVNQVTFNQATVSVPLMLVQGGMVIMVRTPILVGPPPNLKTSTPGQTPLHLWGVASIALDRNTLLQGVGLSELDSTWLFAVRAKDERGLGLPVFWGRPKILQANPVWVDVTLPNGSWQIAIVPKEGWLGRYRRSLWIWLIGCALAGTAGVMTFYTSQTPLQLKSVLRQQERLLEDIFEQAPVGMYLSDLQGTVFRVNDRLGFLLKLSSDRVIGRPCLDLVPPEEQAAHSQAQKDLISGRCSRVALETRYWQGSGSVYWVNLCLSLARDDHGEALYFIAILEDIDQRKQSEANLRSSEGRFRALFEQAAIGICQMDRDGRYLRVNRRFCELLGYSEEEITHYHFQDLTHPEDLECNLDLSVQLWQGEIPVFTLEKRYLRKDGQSQWVSITVSLVRPEGSEPPYTLSIVEDISARREAEEKLTFSAFYDGLTGLPNRNLFIDRLRVALAQSQRHPDRIFAVLYIDLDRFKVINDSLGHHAGDDLLTQIAERLKHCIRQSDTIARLGGDEFAVLLDDAENPNEAKRVADRIQSQLQAPFVIQDHDFYTSASIGIALSHNPSTGDPYSSHQALMRDADIAMYRAKAQGKACYQIFDPTMHHLTLNQLQLESDLRQALDRNGLNLYFQPIFALDVMRLTGFEALVRWHHADRGWISPSEFVPVAEETDLIVRLGEWVLRAACKQVQQWMAAGCFSLPMTISVNLSGRQFAQPLLVETIEGILRENQVNPRSLRIEVTESVIAERVESVILTLNRLQSLGVQSCIDDFGTGYSSLSRLQSFPIDALKIDRSFVTVLPESNDGLEIIRTIINLARSLRIRTVAEGIETQAQLDQLRELGCDYGQGYLFSKPVDAEQAQALLIEQRLVC